MGERRGHCARSGADSSGGIGIVFRRRSLISRSFPPRAPDTPSEAPYKVIASALPTAWTTPTCICCSCCSDQSAAPASVAGTAPASPTVVSSLAALPWRPGGQVQDTCRHPRAGHGLREQGVQRVAEPDAVQSIADSARPHLPSGALSGRDN
jgi:hypothetical protein